MTKPAPDPEPLEVMRFELRLTAQERAAIGEMTRRGGFQSVTHVVLSGLWLLGADAARPVSSACGGEGT